MPKIIIEVPEKFCDGSRSGQYGCPCFSYANITPYCQNYHKTLKMKIIKNRGYILRLKECIKNEIKDKVIIPSAWTKIKKSKSKLTVGSSIDKEISNNVFRCYGGVK